MTANTENDSCGKSITDPNNEIEIRKVLTQLLDLKKLDEEASKYIRNLLERLCDIQSRINFLETACEYEVFSEIDREKFSLELSQRYIEQQSYIEIALRYTSFLQY